MADHKTLSPQVGLSLEPRSGHAQEGYSGEIYEQASSGRKKKRRRRRREEGERKKKEGGEPGRIKQQSCEGKEREVRIKNKKRTMRSKGIERCSQTSDYSGGG
jgi:hypothetical protein